MYRHHHSLTGNTAFYEEQKYEHTPRHWCVYNHYTKVPPIWQFSMFLNSMFCWFWTSACRSHHLITLYLMTEAHWFLGQYNNRPIDPAYSLSVRGSCCDWGEDTVSVMWRQHVNRLDAPLADSVTHAPSVLTQAYSFLFNLTEGCIKAERHRGSVQSSIQQYGDIFRFLHLT